MRLIWNAAGLGIALAAAGYAVVDAVDSALSRVSLYRQSRAAVLDSLFGPEEHFEFEGATTPRKPPKFS